MAQQAAESKAEQTTWVKLPLVAQIVIAVAILIVGVFVAVLKRNNFQWETIGLQLALAGVVLMFLHERIKAYDEEWRLHLNPEKTVNERLRVAARNTHPFLYVVGIPLVLLGALYQMLGNPSDDAILRLEKFGEDIIVSAGSNKFAVSPGKTAAALDDLDSRVQQINDAFGGLSSMDLRVQNCKKEAKCPCPEHYNPVPDSGGWNLNAGTTGDSIVLCARTTSYAMPLGKK